MNILAPRVRESRCRHCCRTIIAKTKQTKADSAEVKAGVSSKLIQVRVTIFAIFCIQHEIFPHRWSTPGHHKIGHGLRGGHRWGCDGKCGGHRWVTLGCQHGLPIIVFKFKLFSTVFKMTSQRQRKISI